MLSGLCGKMKLPLYLDTVGTIAAAIIGGPLPGVIVGFFTNIFKSFTDISSLYYGIINVLIALTAAFLAKKNFYKKPLLIVAAILVFTFLGGGIGTLIPVLLNNVSYDSESLSAKIYSMGMFGSTASHLIANLITDFADKALSVTIVLILNQLLPDHAKKFFNFYSWKQTPLSQEQSAAAKNAGFRKMSLRTKILLVLSISLIAVSVAATVISIVLYRNTLIRDHTKVAVGTARIAASAIDPEKVDEFLEKGEQADGYAEVEQLLTELRISSVDIEYVYVYKIMPDGCHVVFDVDTETVKAEMRDISNLSRMDSEIIMRR